VSIAPDADDLAAFLGSPVDEARAELILGIVTDAVMSYLSRGYANAETTTTAYLVGTGGARLVIGDRIASVESVTIDGQAVTDFRALRAGELWRDGGWGGHGSEVVVTYSSVSNIPQPVWSVVLTCSARLLNNPDQNTYMATDGGYAWRSDAPGLQFTPAEQAILDRYRRRTWP
jgi:hypothetical protein